MTLSRRSVRMCVLLWALLVPGCGEGTDNGDGGDAGTGSDASGGDGGDVVDGGGDIDGGIDASDSVDGAVLDGALPDGAVTGDAAVIIPDGCIATTEVCDGMDNNCNGMVDEGNPGGGVSCTTDVGGCTGITVCVTPNLICRGTFVSPLGSPTGEGSRADPLDTINAGMLNAIAIGGGADVCVCDEATAGPSIFNEDVTMVEGVSVLGGYNCADWSRDITMFETTIQDQDLDGVAFPVGLTAVTALDGMNVLGMPTASGTTAAITVTDSDPSLIDVDAEAGLGPTSIGVHVVVAGGTASPAITRGRYNGQGSAGGTAAGGRFDGSSPVLTAANFGTVIGAGGATPPDEAYGIQCRNCAGTTADGGRVNGGQAVNVATGFYGTGAIDAVTLANMQLGGGATPTAGAGEMRGVHLDACSGGVSLSSSDTFGGSSAGPNTSRWGIDATGAACQLSVDGGSHIGCEFSGDCVGISCVESPCSIANASRIIGSGGPGRNTVGVFCSNGGCSTITNNLIVAGNLNGSGTTGIGLEIRSSSTLVDDNNISGPGSLAGALPPAGRYHGVLLAGSRNGALLTNNVVLAGDWPGRVETVRYQAGMVGPAVIEPTIHSNTIEYAACTGCGSRVGLFLELGGALPRGVVRNNIIVHAAAGGVTIPVEESNATSDFRVFENNDLFDVTAAPGVYFDEGTTGITIATLNGLTGAAANFSADCGLDATWHIGGSTMCEEGGTLTGAPSNDFDSERRPFPVAGLPDVGADERVP